MCFLTFGMRFMFFSYMFKCVLDIMYFFVFVKYVAILLLNILINQKRYILDRVIMFQSKNIMDIWFDII